jgi:hypothetical protein
MEREVRRVYQQIRDAAYADTEKPFTNDEFDQSIEDVTAFVRRRAGVVITEIDALRR